MAKHDNISIKYLTLSDIHLGHNTNKTIFIIANLRKYFLDNHKLISQLDMIFINGDVFHKLLTTNSQDYRWSIQWLTELGVYCSKYNIMLRILEGTPSHDWKQCKVLEEIYSPIDLNFKYHDTLTLEHIDKFNIDILYIPDEYKHTAEETFVDVKALLKENHLKKVDLVMMHGQFKYQLPQIELPSSHTEEDYINITRYFIHAGHIHTSSTYGKILINGSFDRLAQGEEEHKGGIYVEIVNGNPMYQFIKNPDSVLYNTYDCRKMDMEHISKMITKTLKKIRVGSNIRIIVDDIIPLSSTIFKKEFVGYNIELAHRTTSDTKNKYNIKQSNIPNGFAITPANITELLLAELSKHKLTENELVLARNELANII